MQEITEC